MRRTLWVAVATLSLCGLWVPCAIGQAVYGSILGTISDPSGAAISGAKVTVTSVNKGTVEQTTTNADGNYSVSHLIPDVYNVKAEAAGFKSFEAKNVTVNVDTATRIDGQFQVGGTSETVEVTAETPQLKTDRADVATTFDEKQVEDLPIYNRNFTTFQLLSPGTQRLNGWNHAASENPQGSQQILTNGQHFSGTGFELDGTDNQDPILGIIVINPNLDSINEVKITAQDYDAEFGKAIGAVVTSQTKSGSNEFHGSLFDYQRSNSNFAKDPFTQADASVIAATGDTSKVVVPSGNWNQFGGSLGGPIAKNKLFFFGDYQGTRSHIGGSASERIPTAAERTGDLSAWYNAGVHIYDPCTSTLTGFSAACNVPLAERAEFVGGIIPAARLSPQAQKLLALLPVGGTPSPDLTSNNFAGSGNNTLDSDGFDVRMDYSATSKLQVFGRYSLQKFLRAGPGLFGNTLGGSALPSDPSVGNFAGTSHTKNQSLAAGFDYAFSTTLLTDFRFGYMRYHVQTAPGGAGTTPAADAGIPGLNLGDTYSSGMPAFQINEPNGASTFQFGYSLNINQCNCPLLESEHQYQVVNNWTKIRGNHNIKFGVDLRHAYNLRVPSDSHRAGELTFNDDTTAGPAGGSGSGLAAFLLGTTSTFIRYVSSSTDAYETQPRYFFYGQDTWRITPKLTFNYGLRWEIYKPEAARGTGQGGWIDFGTGEVRIAGENGVNLRGNTITNYHHFAPRLGVAYQVTPATVLRMGYGRSYDMGVFGTIFGHTITQTLPVLAQQSINPGTNLTAFTLDAGPPSGDPASALDHNCNPINHPGPIPAAPTPCQVLGPNGRPMYPGDKVGGAGRRFNNVLPYVDAWNVSLQRQFTPSLSATIAYVGNKGTHTFTDDSPSYGANNPTVVGYYKGCTLDPTNPTLPDPATCPAGAVPQELRRPFYFNGPRGKGGSGNYGWTQGVGIFGNDANSHYNSLQATVDKRFASGLQFQGSYTFQHVTNYDDGNYYNIDPRVVFGAQPNYRDHVFIFTETYAFPFGKGKKWAGNAGRLEDLLIGGWSISSATNFSSGLPFTPSLNDCSPSSDTGPCRPNKVGGVKSGTRSGDPRVGGYWFQNTGGVSLSTAGQTAGPWGQPLLDSFGNVGRDTFRGPKLFNMDATVFKDLAITEKVKAQLQFQFYNAFNHLNLDLPNATVDSTSGGAITAKAYGTQMRSLTFGARIMF
jgi:Carboxypeptidase regulatory-like domain/TonB dependent receptor